MRYFLIEALIPNIPQSIFPAITIHESNFIFIFWCSGDRGYEKFNEFASDYLEAYSKNMEEYPILKSSYHFSGALPYKRLKELTKKEFEIELIKLKFR